MPLIYFKFPVTFTFPVFLIVFLSVFSRSSLVLILLRNLSRNAANADVKDVKEGKEKLSDGGKDGKEVEQARSVSVMSTLSYRKRSNLKDSIGGKGDESSLFSTLKEQPDTPDHTSIRKAKSKSGEAQEDYDDKGSVISQAYSEATSRARKGLESRWASRSSPEFDRDSMVSSVAPSRMSTRRGMLDMDDDNKSTISSVSRSSPRALHRSTSWKDDRRSSSRLSLARSCGLSEFGLNVDDDDDDDDGGKSVAFSEGGTSVYSPRSLSRSFSNPGQTRSSDSALPDSSDIKTVSHRNYLDPDLEAAINEVLSFKPIKFKRSKLDESSSEEEDGKKGPGSEDSRRRGEDEGLGTSSLLRSSSGSALDYGNRPSSTMSSSSSRSRRDKKSKVSLSDDSSSDDRRSKRSSRGKKDKKPKKRSKKKQSESEDSSSSSKTSDSSSSDSTISYRSSSSVKRSPKHPSDDDDKEPAGHRPSSKKDTKKKQKKMDNMMMKYLYRPDSDWCPQ